MNIKSLKTCVVAVVALFAGQVVWGQKTVHNSFPDLEIDENTKLVTYKEVVNQKGSSEELYERAVKWANKYFSNPSVVIQKADKIGNVLVCLPSVKISTLANDGKTAVMAGIVYYTLTIEARENRYRYTIAEIHKREQTQYPIEKWLDTTKPEWTPARYDHLHQIDEAIKKLIADLEEGMQPEKVIIDEW
jgi:hypothetical protein